MAGLLDRLNQDLATAVKNRDSVRVSTLRFLLSAIHNRQIAKGADLSDSEILQELGKNAKKHKESIEAFKAAGRTELVEKETAELAILAEYLPEPFSDEELSRMVDEAIRALDAKGAADVGRVVGAVMSSAGAKADGARVAQIVRLRLASNV
ncbi:GatB/YqeY domain-containing protein [Candidatus Curtissbacteria bacterium]|nr:GatB/YqeY domain-containing protein [Candidatus Curtissbacteria bacterium]